MDCTTTPVNKADENHKEMDLAATQDNTYSEDGRLKVKPRLTLYDAIVFILGAIIGSGIFISPKGALLYSGSVGLSLVIWVSCGVLSFLFALVYAELGVMLPRSGGDYMYIKTGVSPAAAFLVSWIQTLIITNGVRAILALVFADYVCAPIFDKCGPPNIIRQMLAILKLMLIAMTNTISVRLVKSLQWVFTLLKISALIIIAVGGIIYLSKGRREHFEDSFSDSKTDVSSIGLAIYSCMWAFSGFQHLNEIAEEVISPRKTFPRAIMASIIIVTFIYILANVSYFTILTKQEFLSSSAVAFDWAEIVLGSAAIIIPIGVVCSVYGAGNGGAMSESRLRFASSRAGHLPEVLSFLHPRTRIPVVSLWFNTLCAVLMLILIDIQEIINLVSFVNYIIVGLSMVASFRLRSRTERQDSDFKLPSALPVVAGLICIFMVVAPLVNQPKIEFLYGALIIAAGLVFYVPFVHFRWTIPGFDHVTLFLQLLFDVCPTVEEDKL